MNVIPQVQNTNTIKYADFFRLGMRDGTYYFATTPTAQTIPSISSTPFTALGQLVKVNSVQRDIKSTANETTVTLIGVDTTMLGLVLNSYIKGSSIDLWHGFFGPDNNLVSNMLTYSSPMNQGLWSGYCGPTTNITYNTTDTPDPNGTYTALKLIRDTNSTCGASTSFGLFYDGGSSFLTVGKKYTVSVWAKCASGTKNFSLEPYDGTGQTRTMTTQWQRFSSTIVATSSARGFQFVVDPGVATCYFWGAQLQEGELTSYVPTTATANTGVYKYFSGYVNSFSISEQWMEETRAYVGVVTISASSFQLVLQNRTAGRYTNDNAWTAVTPGDTSMNRVSYVSTINYAFGKTP